uniref:Mitochondrial import inner membrane translocase subunit tim-16 n=1 Tax=Ditylenchus dipsaci TaxID=166011 RepID=A0A915EAG8_9BILA
MVLRNLAKVAIAFGEAVGKAFQRAVKEEFNASKHAAQNQASASSSTSSSRKTGEQNAIRTNARMGISLQESMQILNVKPPLDPSEIEEKYKHLFEVNDKTKGGSLYLQSKVYRAKERIDEELRLKQQETKEET